MTDPETPATDTRREGLTDALRGAADEMHRLRQRKDARILRELAADLETLRPAIMDLAKMTGGYVSDMKAWNRIASRLNGGDDG